MTQEIPHLVSWTSFIFSNLQVVRLKWVVGPQLNPICLTNYENWNCGQPFFSCQKYSRLITFLWIFCTHIQSWPRFSKCKRGMSWASKGTENFFFAYFFWLALTKLKICRYSKNFWVCPFFCTINWLENGKLGQKNLTWTQESALFYIFMRNALLHIPKSSLIFYASFLMRDLDFIASRIENVSPSIGALNSSILRNYPILKQRALPETWIKCIWILCYTATFSFSNYGLISHRTVCPILVWKINRHLHTFYELYHLVREWNEVIFEEENSYGK